MLKDEIRRAREIELPISGGYGSSMVEAIVIHYVEELDMYAVENIVQHYLFEKHCTGRRLVRQELLSKDGRIYDHFISECEYKLSSIARADLGDLYFDITEGWNRMFRDSNQAGKGPGKK